MCLKGLLGMEEDVVKGQLVAQRDGERGRQYCFWVEIVDEFGCCAKRNIVPLTVPKARQEEK